MTLHDLWRLLLDGGHLAGLLAAARLDHQERIYVLVPGQEATLTCPDETVSCHPHDQATIRINPHRFSILACLVFIKADHQAPPSGFTWVLDKLDFRWHAINRRLVIAFFNDPKQGHLRKYRLACDQRETRRTWSLHEILGPPPRLVHVPEFQCPSTTTLEQAQRLTEQHLVLALQENLLVTAL